MEENLVKQESYFTRREWILRYSSPFKSLMFMAGPMIVIMLVNSLYGIVDKQLTLNFAVDEVTRALHGKGIDGFPPIWSPNLLLNGVTEKLFAKQLINVSTQYSNTIITILQALSLFTATGTGIRFGQAMGARDRDRMNNVMISGFMQTVILIIVSTVILSFVYPYILTSQAGISYANRYDSWQFALSNEYSQMFVFGMPLLAISNFLITLMRTEGKVLIVIANNVVCVFLNIIFGIIFMEVLDLGMKGAVFGSMVSWGFSITVSVIVIATSKDTFLRPNFRRFVWSTNDALNIWVMGISPLMANLVFAIVSYVSTILITNLHDFSQAKDSINAWLLHSPNGLPPDKSQLATLDPAYLKNYNIVAVLIQNPNNPANGHYQVSERISNTLRIMSSTYPWLVLVYAPLIGMSQGASVNYAYNIGANKRQKIIKIFKIQILINVIWMIIAETMINTAGKEMMQLFGYVDSNYYWFQIFLAPLIFATLTQATISMFQGLGNPRNALIVTLFRALVTQVSFVVIGWAIARHISDDGSKDWSMFLMNGLQEVPAFLLALIMSMATINNWKITGQLIDVPDSFKKPSISNIIEGEFKTTLYKEEAILVNKLRKFKEHNSNPESIRNYEEIINIKINALRFINKNEMSIEIVRQVIKEAKIYDSKNYKLAKFEVINAVEEAKKSRSVIKQVEKNVIEEFKNIKDKKNKYRNSNKLDMKDKLIILIWEEKMLIKLSSEVEKVFKFIEDQINSSKINFNKHYNYFKLHEAEILEKIKQHEIKRTNKEKEYIKKQEENKKRYAERIASNPSIAAKHEKHIEKIKISRQKELEAYNKRTELFKFIIARREKKREEKIMSKK